MEDQAFIALLTDENNNCKSITKSKLQEFLRERDLPVSGTKGHLLERVRGVIEHGLDHIVDRQEQTEKRDADRHRQRLITPLGEILPEPNNLIGWKSQCLSFPTFTEKELYNYLVLSRNTFDHEAVAAKKQLGKAQVFYDDGHIQNILYHGVSENSSHCFIKCNCLPSFPGSSSTKKPAYKSWICVSKVTGHVHSARCECVAGERETCNHIAALMIALTDITRKQSEGKLAPTSLACSWVKPRQRALSPKKSSQITFAGRSAKDVSSVQSLESQVSKDKGEDNSIDDHLDFKTKLMAVNPNAAWLQNFAPCKNDDQPVCSNVTTADESVPSLHNLDRLYRDNVDLQGPECTDFFQTYFRQLYVSPKDCVKIYDVTLGQSSNNLWFEARFGRLTASRFGTICRRKPTTRPDNLLKLLLGYAVPYQGKQVSHGLQYEQRARDSYLLISRDCHPPMKVKDCGLCINPSYPHLGASPDAFCICAHCDIPEGLLEIKCPFKYRNDSPQDAAKNKEFYCTLTKDGFLRLKRSHNYYYQIQGQMGITGRKWCDFVIWTFKGISFERVIFNSGLWQEMLIKLNDFFMNCVLSELFSERVKRGIPLFH